ncbi:MAG: hypothetical protein RR923_03050, partial [Bacilli bacterium]
MDHSFNTDIAIKFGVHEAVFIHNMFFWIEKNRANNKHFYENNYWTYNSLTALEKLFPYLTRSQIRTTINNCVNSGAVIRGVFNKEGYDKTAWFSLSDDITCLYTGCAKIDT